MEEHEPPAEDIFIDLQSSDEDVQEGFLDGTNSEQSADLHQPESLDNAVSGSMVSQPVPSPPSSPTQSSAESIEQRVPEGPVEPLLLAIGLWLEKSGCSRQDYTRLREVFLLSHHLYNQGIDLHLPLKLDTLKRQVRGHLPILKLKRKAIHTSFTKLASLPARGKKKRIQVERLTWLYWYDPLDLVMNILSATQLTEKMHFGLAELVDDPTEYWQSTSWAGSNLSTSGHFCVARDGQHILVGDMVKFERTVEGFSRGRVMSVYIDRRLDSPQHNTVVVHVQVILGPSDIGKLVDVGDDLTQILVDLDPQELIIWENEVLTLTPDTVLFHLDISLDRTWDGEDECRAPDPGEFLINKMFNSDDGSCTPLRLRPPLRGELEMEHFGRDQLCAFATSDMPRLSLPIILFVDDFGVHRNMYRALKAFYWIPANLPYPERRKLANVFTFSLGPHGADLADIINAFKKAYTALAEGVVLEINGQMTLVRAFIITMIGDMPQQADNSGFLRHNATYGCRSCMCPKAKYHDLTSTYPRRYHWDVTQKRQHGETLDLVLSRPYDVPHSEWRGLGRVLQGLLIQEVLTAAGREAYLRHFQSFHFPPGWGRIQSPLLYIWSWSLTEAGRATLLTPLVLRCHSRPGWFRMRFVQELSRVVGDTGLSPTENVIRAYTVIAKTNAATGRQAAHSIESIHELVLQARTVYQQLLQAATNVRRSGQQPVAEDDDDDASSADEQVEEGFSRMLDPVDNGEDIDVSSSDQELEVPATEAASASTDPKSKYERLQQLPNVHIGRHIWQNIAEYATVMNCNVLAGESRFFKGLADHAAPANLMGYLFAIPGRTTRPFPRALSKPGSRLYSRART